MNIVSLKKCFPLLGLIFAFAAGGCSTDKNSGQAAIVSQMPPSLVQISIVEQKNIPYTDDFIATTEGSKAVEVRAQVTGILKEKRYEEGQFVEAGSVLFLIEPDSYDAALIQAKGALTQAQAGLTQAKLNYDRIQALYKQNAISKKEFDSVQASYDIALGQLDSARASVTEAQIRVGYTSVIAPVSGYTGEANYSVGNLVTGAATLPLTVINQVDPLYVNFSMPSTSLNFIKTLSNQNKLIIADNMTVKIKLEDGSIYSQTGNVTFFDKQVSAVTGDIKVRAEVLNPNLALFPGQFVKVTLQGYTLTDAIVIPQKAILKMGTKSVVITVDNSNTAHYTPVTTVTNIGNDFLIASGLKAGDRIVVEGQNKVRDGGQVSIAPSAPAAPVATGK